MDELFMSRCSVAHDVLCPVQDQHAPVISGEKQKVLVLQRPPSLRRRAEVPDMCR